MDIFTIAYIFLLTVCIAAVCFCILLMLKKHNLEIKTQFNYLSSYDPRRIKELKHDKWVVIRYVDVDKNGEEFVREDEISLKTLLKLMSDTADNRYK